MILLIDNYDSFSHNLYQMVGNLSPDIQVIRNDAMTVEEMENLNPAAILLSPGSGKPSDAGRCEEVVQKLAGKIPILGVCLGHQAICEVYGGSIGPAKELMHGKQSVAEITGDCPLFQGLGKEVRVARYHSLALEPETLPDCLEAVARTEDGEIMAVQHREYPVYGLQFHPESILTPEGETILKNFIKLLG